MNHWLSVRVGCERVAPRMLSRSPFFDSQETRVVRRLGARENLTKRPLCFSTGSPPAVMTLHSPQVTGQAFRMRSDSYGSE